MLVRSLVLLSFLSTGVAAQQVDTTVTKAAVMAADRALADRVAKDGPQAFLAALDPGAAVLFPGQPILRGRVGSERPFLARYSSPSSFSWSPVHAVVGTDGRFACTVGFSRFMNARDTSHLEHKGTYLTCWQRSGMESGASLATSEMILPAGLRFSPTAERCRSHPTRPQFLFAAMWT